MQETYTYNITDTLIPKLFEIRLEVENYRYILMKLRDIPLVVKAQ